MTPLFPTGDSGLSRLLQVLADSLGFGGTSEMHRVLALAEELSGRTSGFALPDSSRPFHPSFGMALGLFV